MSTLNLGGYTAYANNKPSPFGKGDRTVMDLKYRNGRKIEAMDIIIGSQA